MLVHRSLWCVGPSAVSPSSCTVRGHEHHDTAKIGRSQSSAACANVRLISTARTDSNNGATCCIQSQARDRALSAASPTVPKTRLHRRHLHNGVPATFLQLSCRQGEFSSKNLHSIRTNAREVFWSRPKSSHTTDWAGPARGCILPCFFGLAAALGAENVEKLKQLVVYVLLAGPDKAH